jgi:hypothetical protein
LDAGEGCVLSIAARETEVQMETCGRYARTPAGEHRQFQRSFAGTPLEHSAIAKEIIEWLCRSSDNFVTFRR